MKSASPEFKPVTLAVLTLTCALTGPVYIALGGEGRWPTAALYATCIGLCVLGFERGVLFRRFHARIRRMPTLLYVPLAELVYVALIAVGNVIGGSLAWVTGLTSDRYVDAIRLTPRVLAFALACSAIIVVAARIRDLIGSRVLVSLLTGRYHRPIQEERIFLFIDLVGSTAYAEMFGDLRTQAFLGAFFATLAGPVRRNGGSIDDYVGDLAIVTWPLARGLKGGRCVRCVFDFAAAIREDGAAWQARYGGVPAFRAALHGGPVVTAEIGVDRHKITFFGDTVNATSRIESLCRTLDQRVLISADLFRRLPALPPGIEASARGAHPVRGRDQPIEVYGLTEAAEREPVPSRHPATAVPV